jgi:diguanylate cyclase (GGDEF)-like protein
MSDQPVIRVLLVEDNQGDARLIQEWLAEAGAVQFEVTHLGLIRQALDRLSKHAFDVLLLDLSLPDGRGLSNLNQIQAIAPNLPVIIVSNNHDEQLALHAVKAGAQDYLVKGRGDGHVLARVMRYAIERKRVDERMAYLAHYDVLTGLPNRVLFRDRLTRAFAHAQRHGHNIALMFLDLDHFKSINDTLGHDAGDQFLKAVARRLENCVRRNDTIARLGGDEFTVILEDVNDSNDVVAVADKIVDAMSRSHPLEGHEVFVTVSIGIALYPSSGLDAATLIKNADTALYNAKEHGRSCYRFYNPQMHVMASERLAMVTALRHAVRRQEFVLHYQPQLDPRTQRVHGVEALLRWNHPENGLISPSQFIHLLEDTGLIITVGEWVLRDACRQQRALQDAGMPVRMSVNVSMRQFRQPDFVDRVAGVVRESRIDPQFLQLEVTESLLVDNVSATTAKLHALREIGIRISIDDFGTGYCSLSYLKQFPLQTLKLDHTFIKDIEHRSNDAAIANAIIALGHSLNMEVVAEGVETERQLDFLRGQGCDAVQGFLYSEPMPAHALPTWLREQSTAAVARGLTNKH